MSATDALPLVEELAPAPDPLDSCERCAALPYRILLDSAADPGRLGRYSFLAADPALVVRAEGARTELLRAGADAPEPIRGDALAAVRTILAPFAAAPLEGLPPFQGGAAGYIGYDWGATLERLPSPRYDDLPIPDVLLGVYDWVLAWDHATGHAWIISTGMPETGPARARRARERLEMVRGLLREAGGGKREAGRPLEEYRHADAVPLPARTLPASRFPPPAHARAPSYPVDSPDLPADVGLRSSFTHGAYLDAVARVREYILAGDIFQANLSQRFEAPLRDTPWALYRRLRRRNPAPFAAFLDFGDLAVVSASPERFVRLDERRCVETRPIKGTRPRGVGPEHDAALGRALTESVKDRAENLMIVDLLRNDLSRVCVAGSVRVPELFALEHYATVHHLVSTVVGELAPGADAVDLLRATFPGGSITGAPKVRAMQIIAELEPSRRGVYCGTVGYLGATGVLDTSIVIRTYLALGDRVYFSAGGGIVADSDPEAEYRETLDKGRGLIEALRRQGLGTRE